ncbi:MAG TPA: hypothetical protein VL854_12995 [Nitrososphaeraceae archaeon]|jgi:hypothetical protein|nr:hypothetical protein [Nitrososphaeraceae archaeon]
MKVGGDLGNLKDGELDAWMINHLLDYGITPQMWHPDYKDGRQLSPTHRIDIIRMRNWRNEAMNERNK